MSAEVLDGTGSWGKLPGALRLKEVGGECPEREAGSVSFHLSARSRPSSVIVLLKKGKQRREEI